MTAVGGSSSVSRGGTTAWDTVRIDPLRARSEKDGTKH